MIKSQSDNEVQVGQDITYTLAAFNAGPEAAPDIQVTDALPATMTVRSVHSSQGTCAGLSCSLGTINPGENATMTVVARPTTVGAVTNSGTVTSTVDSTPSNNTSSVTATVVAGNPPPPPPPPGPPPPPPPPGDNHAPTAADDQTSVFVKLVRTLDVVGNDTDPDGDTLSVVAFTQGKFGRVTCAGKSCNYVSNRKLGTDRFSYTVADGRGATATATVMVFVGRPFSKTGHIRMVSCKRRGKKHKLPRPCRQKHLPATGRRAAAIGARGVTPACVGNGMFRCTWRSRCKFEDVGTYGLGGFRIAAQLFEVGKTGTDRMMIHFRTRLFAQDLYGRWKWSTGDQYAYTGDYPDDSAPYQTFVYGWPAPPWKAQTWAPFTAQYVGYLSQVEFNFHWIKRHRFRRDKIVYETGWLNVCRGTPSPGIER